MFSIKKIISNTFKILTIKEKSKLVYLLLFNTSISILDIASIVILVFVIGYYSGGNLKIIGHENLLVWLSNKNHLFVFLAFLVFMSIKNWLGVLSIRKQFTFVYQVALRIAQQNLTQYFEEKYDAYTNTDSSAFVRKIAHQPVEYCHYVLAGLQQIFIEFVLITITLVAIIIYNAELFLGLFIVLVPPVLLITYFNRRKLKSARSNIKNSNEKVLQYLQEALRGYVDINLYNGKRYFIHRFYMEQEKLCEYLPDIQSSQGLSTRMMEVFAVLGLFILFLTNYYFGNPWPDIIWNIGAFIGAAYKIIPSVMRILNLGGQIMTYGYTSEDFANEIPDAPLIPQQSANKISSISFQDVSFRYHKKWILENYNTSFLSGDFVGISAPSGTGKTTFVHLLLGFLDENTGNISFNGIPTQSNDRKGYWNNIAYVKQQTFLMHDTIQHNICFENEPLNKSRFLEALEISGLNEYLEDLPEKAQKIVTENGKNISGGQQQRIAIARALYKEADVYILDEPFNELDEASELKIILHFKEIAQKGAIVLLITHNQKSLNQCNKVLYL